MKARAETLLLALAILSAICCRPSTSYAQNSVVTYQGHLQSGGVDFSGIGQFKFVLVTVTNTAVAAAAIASPPSGGFITVINVTFGGRGYLTPPAVTISGGGGSGATAFASVSGGVVTSITVNNPGGGYSSTPAVIVAPPPENLLYTTYWSNDGTSTAGSEPSASVPLPVNNGGFTARLGDDTWPNMTPLPAGVFGQPDLHLRLWFNDGTNGFAALHPPQPLTAAPYARYAANLSGTVATSQLVGKIAPASIADGTITSAMLATGAVGSGQLAAGAVTTGALADGAVTTAKVATVSNWSALTIANPNPESLESFGSAVAGVGPDRVLVGAYYDNTAAGRTGAAYLFSTNGALLTTFYSPTPAVGDNFGYSVGALGADRVLIGAFRAGANDGGAAYLFSTNGALLMTFNNPTPALNDNFGLCLAAVGTDRVLIGAEGDNTGANLAGVAHLFSTNGALLMTFTNPSPAAADYFGDSVTGVGADRVLIGASLRDAGASDSGAAYLFSVNGALLTTFTNPTPAASDQFGASVAAVGEDRVLIGAYLDDSGATDSGAAYLFSANGALLMTFTNPTPAASDGFGRFVAAAGSDRVLIGAAGDSTGATFTGAAYLFNTNGVLLTTLTNPAPQASDYFGGSGAAVGNDRVVVGASADDTGANDAGAAYLFSQGAYTPGLVAESVNKRSITTASLEDGAVTLTKLDPAIGIWTRSGDNVFRLAGNVGIGTAVPQASLQVIGDIRLGPSGQFFTPGGQENLRIIRGVVAADGTILAGLGFSVLRNGVGDYTVVFSPQFVGLPTVTATVQTGLPRAATVTNVGNNSAQVRTWVTTTGAASDQQFHFIAIGPWW